MNFVTVAESFKVLELLKFCYKFKFCYKLKFCCSYFSTTNHRHKQPPPPPQPPPPQTTATTDPSGWTKADVKTWLKSVIIEYRLVDVDMKRFANTDGQKISQMTMRDFCRMTCKANADVILNQLSHRKQSSF